MKEANYQTTGLNSLSIKFSALVFLLTVVASTVIAFAMLALQQDVLIEQERLELLQTTNRYAKQLDSEFWQKEKKAISANQVVSRFLAQQSKLPPLQLEKFADGSIRSKDDLSAAFQKHSTFVATKHRYFEQTELLWQQLAPVLLEDFFNFYFISKDGFIRISPSDWALEIPADHQFSTDIFFDIATPANNPARLPRWTPLYFDAIWQKWMTSLVIPVYINDEFVGITGTDVVLDEIFSNLGQISQWESGREAMLFDGQGNLLHDSQNSLQQAIGNPVMNQLAVGVQSSNPQLAAFIKRVVSTPAEQQNNSKMLDDYVASAAKIERLDWFVALYHHKDSVIQSLDDYRDNVVLLFLMVALIVALALQFFIYKFVLKRLTRLAGAVQRLSYGEPAQLELDQRPDEIGLLNRAFVRMSDEIHQLISGLNTRILEKEEAERATRKLSKAVAFSSSGIVITDHQLVIEYVNPFLLEMIDATATAVIGQPLHILFAQEMKFVGADILQSLQERQHWRGDMLLQQGNKQFWASLAIAPIRDDKGDVGNYVCAMQDISFIKESQRKMEQLAYYDVLTGLANRSYFRDQLRKAIAMSSRGYYHFALLYFDLDEFKRINDTLGHDAGDELLKEVARRLISRLREEDTIARLGGDEFAVILSGISDRKQAASIATNLQQAFALPVKLAGHDVSISASIGITIAPEDADEEELLLKHADLAMYEAKARGKNTFHFFSQDLNEAANERLQIENQLREAIREQQFLLYYQPKIDIRTEKIIGYETLLRWLRPDNTMVPPLRFIPVAESTGLIVQIGEWIIWEACRFLTRQHARGHLITVSINLSARQFTDQDLPALVERIVKRTGASPAHLIFEITESMLMGDIDAAIVQLNELKRLGLALSIDDFGTGYSSLSYLKRFPVDELKIDRSFVKDIPEDKNDMDITAAIIAMAQKMDLRVVAEGVETIEQVEFLKNNACYLVQGYYYSMPLAEQELTRLNFETI
ncbi:diguanylate phosphodiesterase [Rheinheimera sp. SA_1]|uniref:bifunctional diguanylate cyclase/phosphodiesterase n=1 Tax=Rheinheimera sp. SA_1 TaxID=1827365 RepID=UPI0007FF40E0|nr:EAL domain-containing protein [Rheinheimera sp. SA_1]OBP15748.1 diguanylate phosphodiesterase [Rheinheimera sp. SA_1]